MKLRFTLTFKHSVETVAIVEGVRDIDTDDLTVDQLQRGVLETEAFVERLTGLRLHIESHTVRRDNHEN